MTFQATVCPHDCPSCCALEVDVNHNRISTVRGAAGNNYTAGVICAKVSRYAERQHHPERLTVPLLRTGPKGAGQFRPISWDRGASITWSPSSSSSISAAQQGAEAVWPYYFRRHDGACAARRHQPAASRDGVFAAEDDDLLHHHGFRMARGCGPDHRTGPAGNGRKRPDRDVGRESRSRRRST